MKSLITDPITLKQMRDNPITVECSECHWAGDIRECPTRPVGFLGYGGEIDYELEPVCPVCRCPYFKD